MPNIIKQIAYIFKYSKSLALVYTRSFRDQKKSLYILALRFRDGVFFSETKFRDGVIRLK